MFLSDYSHPIEFDEKSMDLRRAIKTIDEYGPVMDMPKDLGLTQKQKAAINDDLQANVSESLSNTSETSTNQQAQSEVERERYADDNDADENIDEIEKTSVQKFATSDSIFNPAKVTHKLPGTGSAVAVFNPGGQQYAVQSFKKNLMAMPKPQWHAPWKLYRVISGHLGWVRCIDVDPSNEWFVTGAGDRIIKIWDLASGQLKLSLTGHVSAVRGVAVSSRHPYLFSCGEDKRVLCWDLEANKVIRHYHGHLQSCTSLSLHPTLDLLVSAGRDSVARVT